MITLRQIEAFRAVITTGTATQAAALLGISQPAVSRLISDLESEVEFEIFLRKSRQLHMTAEGEALYQEIERTFHGLDEIKRVSQEIKNRSRGHLRIVITPSLFRSSIADWIAEFSEERPDIIITVEVEQAHKILSLIANRQCDIAFSSILLRSNEVVSEVLTKTQSFCIVNTAHRLAGASVVRPQDLAGESFVSFRADSIYRHRVDGVFRAAKVERRLRIEARSTDIVYALVNAGVGVSIVQGVSPGEHGFRNVRVIPFTPAIEDVIALYYTNAPTLSLIASSFLEVVKRHSDGAD